MPAAGGGAQPPPPTVPGVPAFPGRILRQPPIMRGEDVRTAQNRLRARGGNLAADGAYGPVTEGFVRRAQTLGRIGVDGRVGPVTWPVLWRDSASVAAAPPAPAPPRPPATPPGFPGPLLRQPPINRAANAMATARRWQQRMRDRGWQITVDGLYGPQSAGTCREFQRRQGIAVDGVVGPVTWARTFA
jgi:peptidoglycan hydrolase-like protein with peptidoglycan-binding domain